MVIETEVDELEYKANLNGEVNGQSISVVGAGRIDSRLGVTEGEYELHKLPDDFDPRFLTAVLITGYPNACAALDNIPNPFVGFSYDYERNILFRDTSSLHLKARCRIEKNHLSSEFYLNGTVSGGTLQGIEPIVETWDMTGSGLIEGRFRAAWIAEDGKQVIAQANTEYHISREVSGMPLMHRFIEIESNIEGARMRLKQLSFAFRRLKVGHIATDCEKSNGKANRKE